MPRRRRTEPAATAPQPKRVRNPGPKVAYIIDPNAVFTIEGATEALKLAESCLDNEIRAGRLRVTYGGQRRHILGSWLLEWLEGREDRTYLQRRQAAANGVAGHSVSD